MASNASANSAFRQTYDNLYMDSVARYLRSSIVVILCLQARHSRRRMMTPVMVYRLYRTCVSVLPQIGQRIPRGGITVWLRGFIVQ